MPPPYLRHWKWRHICGAVELQEFNQKQQWNRIYEMLFICNLNLRPKTHPPYILAYIKWNRRAYVALRQNCPKMLSSFDFNNLHNANKLLTVSTCRVPVYLYLHQGCGVIFSIRLQKWKNYKSFQLGPLNLLDSDFSTFLIPHLWFTLTRHTIYFNLWA